VCWIYSWTLDGACTHACIAARLRVIPWKLACTAVLLAVQSSVDEFRSQDFGLKLNWEAWDQTWCILFCLQNGTLIRPASRVRWTAVTC
jgi:hypothetical protein